jgi:hypothetical protein
MFTNKNLPPTSPEDFTRGRAVPGTTAEQYAHGWNWPGKQSLGRLAMRTRLLTTGAAEFAATGELPNSPIINKTKELAAGANEKLHDGRTGQVIDKLADSRTRRLAGAAGAAALSLAAVKGYVPQSAVEAVATTLAGPEIYEDPHGPLNMIDKRTAKAKAEEAHDAAIATAQEVAPIPITTMHSEAPPPDIEPVQPAPEHVEEHRGPIAA